MSVNSQKIYLVTGAGRGIGLEFVSQLLAQGHTVIATARKPAQALKLKEFESSHKDRFQLLELDVKSDSSAKNLVSQIKFPRVDILINNAGVLPDEDGSVAEVSTELVLETLNVNSIGPIRITQALLPLLRQSSSPVVANLSSMMGSIADNSSGSYLAYRMSKTALNMFVKTLSLDESNITALALHPGWVKTEMGGPSAKVEPSDSVKGLLSIIQKATKAHSGKFFNYTGNELPW